MINLPKEFAVHVSLCERKSGKPITDRERYIFVQLPLFDKKRPEDCITNIDRWFYVLINMYNMETMPFTVQKKLFNRLSEVASYASLSPKEKRRYNADLKAYRDLTNQMEYAKSEALAKGEAKGKSEEKIRLAKLMRKEDMMSLRLPRLWRCLKNGWRVLSLDSISAEIQVAL